jgi:hypothetical protein
MSMRGGQAGEADKHEKRTDPQRRRDGVGRMR